MTSGDSAGQAIRSGDVDGLGRLYSEFGGPILHSQEIILAERQGCDLAAYGSWRLFFPKRIFHPLPGKPSGTIHVTSDRVIFFREIDVWKEVKPLLTPLGLPTAAEKEAKLNKQKAIGARQYCEIFPSKLRLVHVRRKSRLLDMRLAGNEGNRYEVFIYTDRDDPAFFDLLERSMRQSSLRS